jgi:uncharacterized protein YxjI
MIYDKNPDSAPPSYSEKNTSAQSTPPPFPSSSSSSSSITTLFSLPALPFPLGALPAYIAKIPVTLVLRENAFALAGDNSHVRDLATGAPVFVLSGKGRSASARKDVHDVEGRHLFTIRRELFTLLSRYYAVSAAGERFLEVRAKVGLIFKFDVRLVDSCGRGRVGGSKDWGEGEGNPPAMEVQMEMKKDFHSDTAEVNMGKQTLVRIDRSDGGKGKMFMGADSYAITVAPGMDMSCAVALCIALDDSRHNK